MKKDLLAGATVVDGVIKFVSDKNIKHWSELEKHKVDDAVTVDKKHSNDIQGAEEEDKWQQQSTATTNTVFWQITEQTFLDLEYRRAQDGRYQDKRIMLL